MKVLGLAGWSGSGKTTLLVALLPVLRARGLRVSTIKHAHHTVDPDTPGKDSWRHREAGAEEVMLATAERFALFRAYRGGAEPSLDELLARMAPVDLVLVEGFRWADMPKLEVYRPSLGKPPLWPDMTVLAVASDARLPDCPVAVLDLADPAAIGDFVIDRLGLQEAR
jgi:molybdopterin-guanine dinucleotide biosynthesis adapter protein